MSWLANGDVFTCVAILHKND
uniref:Uncharacterized protein n=1 Tax=Anguilla anguilla TaxID=7936 RepID=A0A0E9Q4A4_ANGAN